MKLSILDLLPERAIWLFNAKAFCPIQSRTPRFLSGAIQQTESKSRLQYSKPLLPTQDQNQMIEILPHTYVFSRSLFASIHITFQARFLARKHEKKTPPTRERTRGIVIKLKQSSRALNAFFAPIQKTRENNNEELSEYNVPCSQSHNALLQKGPMKL